MSQMQSTARSTWSSKPAGSCRWSRMRWCWSITRWWSTGDVHRRLAADRRGARGLRAARTGRAGRARADSRPDQQPHAQSDDPAARPGRRPAADGLAAGAHLAGRGEGDRAGIRARRRRAGGGRDAARRHHLRQRELLLPRCDRCDLPQAGFPRRGRLAGDRVSHRLGKDPGRVLRARRRGARQLPRRSRWSAPRSRRMRRTRCPTRASSASACCPISSTSRCTCIRTRPRTRSRKRRTRAACARSSACRSWAWSTIA